MVVRRPGKEIAIIAELPGMIVRRTGREERGGASILEPNPVVVIELNILGCRVDILETNCDQCRSTVQCCFTSTETVRLIKTGSPGWPPRLSHSF